MLYLSFGSNLNVAHMARRCPAAKKVGPYHLPNARMVFRGVADIEYARGESCPTGLWRITKQCERALDNYEGVNPRDPNKGLYRKVYLKARIVKSGKIVDILTYQMNHDGIMPPNEHYVDTIAQGYMDFGLEVDYLNWALQRSWDDKEKTPFLRKRWANGGKLPFATDLDEEIVGPYLVKAGANDNRLHV